MAVPVLLVTGFLGAGKTTLINHLLTEPGGRRLAAVVNDFGAIDIDAALLSGAEGGVMSLANGCICCSLQGDLLQTLAVLLRRDPAPDGIVIETSGVSDPAAIVASLLDPVIWREAALDAVVCVADARHLTDRPALLQDPLCRSQVKAADFIALNKTDLVSAAELAMVRTRLSGLKPARAIHDVAHGQLAPELLFSARLHEPAVSPPASRFATPGFESVSWTSDTPLSLPRFQAVVGRFAPSLLRAKGFVRFAEHPGQAMEFQLVGERATIAAAHVETNTLQLVFIARDGALDRDALRAALTACVITSG